MVIDIQVRRCLNVQYNDMHLENIIRWLLENNDISTLVCVYKGKEYYANIDIMSLRFLASDEELFEYVDSQSIGGWLEEFDINRIGELFFEYKDAETILLEKPNENSKEVLTVSKMSMCCHPNGVDFSTYMKLKQKGIATYIVNIPYEIKSVYGPFGKIALCEESLKAAKNLDLQKGIENFVKRISDFSFDEYVCQILDGFMDRGEEKECSMEERRGSIFLIGPCIIEGYSPSKETMPQILNELLEKYNLPYKIVRIKGNSFPNEILEYNICQRDIVIYIGSGLNYKDYDLTEDYEEYDGTKSLCTNLTMHASQAGCELIANALLNHIIIPHNSNADSLKDNRILHYAEPEQLKLEIEYEVKMYLKRLHIRKYTGGG